MLQDEEINKPTLDRISKRWRESVDKVKEYEIIEREEELYAKSIPSYLFTQVSWQESEEAQKLKQRLLEEYKGKKLENVIDGKEFTTKKGICYHIEKQERISLKIINPEQARERILSDLKLIYGIREVTESILKKQGYKTIKDLTEHPRFGYEAKRFLEIVDKNDTGQIVSCVGRRFPKSHPLALYTSAFHKIEDFIILDIETMGLFTRPIILFGLAQIAGDRILINQYFVRDIKEEPAALMAFLSHINDNSVFITFNGRAFDIRYIRERLVYYGMDGDLEKPHFDLLHFSRRAWGERVHDCSLKTLEKYLLGITRKDDIPSALVPEFYNEYRISENVGPLIPIFNHNKQDLITLANIFSNLHEKWR